MTGFFMKKSLPKLAVVAAALACLGSAQAAVVTFDGLEASPFALSMPLLTHNDEFYQAGFWLNPYSGFAGAVSGADLVGAIVDGTDVANTCFGLVCPTNNSTSFYTTLNDSNLYLGSSDSAQFSISSIDASFVGASGDAFPGTTLILRVRGYDSANTALATMDLQLPGPVAGAFSFSTYAMSASFAATQFDFARIYGFACNASGNCTAFGSDKGQFAIDNITLTTAVPEPSAWLLMGLGLVGLATQVRRRTAA